MDIFMPIETLMTPALNTQIQPSDKQQSTPAVGGEFDYILAGLMQAVLTQPATANMIPGEQVQITQAQESELGMSQTDSKASVTDMQSKTSQPVTANLFNGLQIEASLSEETDLSMKQKGNALHVVTPESLLPYMQAGETAVEETHVIQLTGSAAEELLNVGISNIPFTQPSPPTTADALSSGEKQEVSLPRGEGLRAGDAFMFLSSSLEPGKVSVTDSETVTSQPGTGGLLNDLYISQTDKAWQMAASASLYTELKSVRTNAGEIPAAERSELATEEASLGIEPVRIQKVADNNLTEVEKIPAEKQADLTMNESLADIQFGKVQSDSVSELSDFLVGQPAIKSDDPTVSIVLNKASVTDSKTVTSQPGSKGLLNDLFISQTDKAWQMASSASVHAELKSVRTTAENIPAEKRAELSVDEFFSVDVTNISLTQPSTLPTAGALSSGEKQEVSLTRGEGLRTGDAFMFLSSSPEPGKASVTDSKTVIAQITANLIPGEESNPVIKQTNHALHSEIVSAAKQAANEANESFSAVQSGKVQKDFKLELSALPAEQSAIESDDQTVSLEPSKASVTNSHSDFQNSSKINPAASEDELMKSFPVSEYMKNSAGSSQPLVLKESLILESGSQTLSTSAEIRRDSGKVEASDGLSSNNPGAGNTGAVPLQARHAENQAVQLKVHNFSETMHAEGSKFVIIRNDNSSIEISLQPEGLGKLDIGLVFDKGVVNAEIHASSIAGKEMVERNIADIINALAKEGVTIGGFSVSLRDNKSGQGEPHRQNVSLTQHETVKIGEISGTTTRFINRGAVSIFV